MNKFLRKRQFEKVIAALWDRVKEKFVEDVAFDDVTKKLKKTKNGQDEEITSVITQWGDLDYTIEHKIANIFNKDLIIDNEYHNVVGGLVTNASEWCRYTIPCEPNEVLSVVKKTRDSQVFTFLNSNGTRVEHGNYPPKTVNGWEHYVVTVPNNTDIKMVSVNIYKPHNPLADNTTMIYMGNEEPTTEYYPFADGRNVIIDGSKVALTFDPTGSSLTSSTTHDAIKELDGKIANVGGGTVTSVNNVQPHNGNVTININDIPNLQDSLNNKVNTSDVGNNPNQIPQLDGQGKLDATTMPDLAITSVQTVQTKQDAQNLVTSGQIQVGDVVVVVSDNNSVYMYNGANHQNLFDNNFLELSIGTGTIRELNGLRPLANGQLTVDATHIKLDGQNSQTVKQEIDTLKGRVDNCVIRVNGEAPINGEVTVNAGQIRAAVGGVVNNVQHYLNVIGDGLRTVNTIAVGNRNKITMLEAKKPPVQAGDIITTFKNNGEVYTVGGVTYLYCGVRKVVTRNNYPQLADALGLASSVNNFEYPYFADTQHTYDNGQRTGTKRTYICAKVV